MTPKAKKQIKEDRGGKCEICASLWNLELHHIDRDRKNDDPLNIQLLCRSCHKNTHRGLSWSAELADWDTPFARQKFAMNAHWESCSKQTVILTLDSIVLNNLQAMADQQCGGDLGRYLCERHQSAFPKYPPVLAESVPA